MTKIDKELEQILKELKRFADANEGHYLALVLYEDPEGADKVPVSGTSLVLRHEGDINWLLDTIRHKFPEELERLKQKDIALAIGDKGGEEKE